MSKPDIRTAPADATHFVPETEVMLGAWYKREGDHWMIMTTIRDKWMRVEHPIDLARIDDLVALAWDGEGMPPVGTVCEYHGYPDRGVWYDVEIIAHWKDFAVYVPVEGDAYSTDCGRAIARCFRPIVDSQKVEGGAA